MISALLSTLGPGLGQDERRKCICAHPWCWGSVGLGWCARVSVVHALIPTKTSRFWNQLGGNVPACFSKGFHVFSVSCVNFLFHFVFCAVILSVVSLSLIALFHLLVIPCSLRVFSCMTHSHLSTHIR